MKKSLLFSTVQMQNVTCNHGKKWSYLTPALLARMRWLLVISAVLATSQTTLHANGGFLYNHFYTADPKERDSAIKNNGFLDESDLDPIYVFTSPVPGSVRLYRLFNTGAGDHFYTTNESERKDAQQHGWVDESNDTRLYPLYVFGQNAPEALRAQAVQLRRFWIAGPTDHFYATDQQDWTNAKNAGGKDESEKEWITAFNAPVAYAGATAMRLWRLYHPGPADAPPVPTGLTLVFAGGTHPPDSNGVPLRLQFSWSPGNQTSPRKAASWQLNLNYFDPDLKSNIHYGGPPSTQPSVDASPLRPNTKYTWSVSAASPYGQSNSESYEFTTGSGQSPPSNQPRADLAFVGKAGVDGPKRQIIVNFTNIGSADSGPFTARAYVDGAGSHQDVPQSSHRPQEISSLTFTIAQVTPGQHQLVFILDVLNQVQDSNRDNNTKNVYFSVSTDGVVQILTP